MPRWTPATKNFPHHSTVEHPLWVLAVINHAVELAHRDAQGRWRVKHRAEIYLDKDVQLWTAFLPPSA